MAKQLTVERLQATGNETVTTDLPEHGYVQSVHVNYSGSSAAGTDVTLTHKGSNGEGIDEDFVDITDSNTDTIVRPRTPVQDKTDTDVTYDGTNQIHERYEVFNQIDLTVAGNNASDTVTVLIVIERD